MSPELYRAIEDVWGIEQDRLSEQWKPVAQRALFAQHSIYAEGDPAAIQRVAKEYLGLIDEKAAKITERIKQVLESYGACLLEVEQADQELRLVHTLSADLEHAKFELGTIRGYPAPRLVALRGGMDEKGARSRRESLHNFRTMLVAVRNTLSERDRRTAGVSVIDSHHVQIGDRNVNTENRQNMQDAPEARVAEPVLGLVHRFGGWLAGIIGTLIAGYLIWRFGWTK